MWAWEKWEEVRRLVSAGLSDYEVSSRTGIPRSTIQKWRTDAAPGLRRRRAAAAWLVADGWTYAYVLGLYLGDGHIVVRRGRPRHLRITLDAIYPQLVAEAVGALGRLFDGCGARQYEWGPARRVILQLCHPQLLEAFPQHGPGRKHDRKIELRDWQREITHAHPDALVRGLIHSDGCRTINRFKTKLPSGRVKDYAYPRYFFSNLSDDIRVIFIEHCELLGVRCTMSNARNVSVSHRRSVAILEEVVGPKR